MGFAAPDLVAPLVGWRAWDVVETPEGWRLHSVHMHDEWPAGEPLAAVCRRDRFVAAAATHARHLSPVASCQCGVYAALSAERARQYFVASWAEVDGAPSPALPADYVPRAIGEVNLWGRVLECAQGYRATYAYPSRIFLPARRPDGGAYDVETPALGLLDYGVPVEVIDVGTRAEIAAALPAAA